MKTIGLWCEEEFEKFYDVTLVKTDDRECFDSFLGDLESQPDAVYELLPNGYADSDLFLFYIKYNFFNNGYMVEPHANKFFFAWEHFVDNIPTYNISALKSYLSIVSSYNFRLLRKKGKLAEVFEALICNIIDPYIKGDIYINMSIADFGRWWKLTNKIHNEIDLFIKTYHKLDTLALLLGPIIKDVKKIQKRLNDILTSPTVPLFQLSAYLFFLSKISYKQNSFILSISLAHRALELYFQFLLMENNLAAFHNGVMRYTVNSSSVNVNLVTSEDLLIQYGDLSTDLGRNNFIIKLNSMRNKCLYMHGVLAFEQQTVKSVLDGCERLITRLAGNTRWRSLSNNMGFNLDYEYKILFDIEENLDTYCTRIS